MRIVWNMKQTLRGVSRRAIRGMPPMGTVDRHIVCAGDFAAGTRFAPVERAPR
jgi:hypothetical protein